jgi:hypothetical protein
MLRLVRKRAWSAAATLLLSLLLTSASQVLPMHGIGRHDVACVPAVAIAHDEGAHRLGAPSGEAAHPLHCLVCHLTRTSRPSPAVVRHTPVLQPHAFVHLDVVPAPTAVSWAQLSLRAPPASIV